MKVYMFHYVVEDFNYYHFDVKQFEKKIKELSETKKVISLKQLRKFQENNEKLEDDYIILTFDDGTIDHYQNVYPILKKYDVTGVFFICSNIFKENILKIHFVHQILNKANIDEVYRETQKYLLENNINIDTIVDKKLENWKEVYVKHLIQTILSQEHSERIINKLVKKYDISTNYENYYMSINNMLEMKSTGMEFGCHTNTHKRLSFLNKIEQNKEIQENMELLYKNNLLTNTDVLSIAYPFGDYDNTTTKVLGNLNFDFAFNVKEEDIYEFDKYQLSRYDCNILKE